MKGLMGKIFWAPSLPPSLPRSLSPLVTYFFYPLVSMFSPPAAPLIFSAAKKKKKHPANVATRKTTKNKKN